jgi:LDH2 family malate/lactate/ureidoglycolate dehydrogenase
VRVAGDPEHAARAARLRDGIPVPAPLADQINALCRTANAAYLFDPKSS